MKKVFRANLYFLLILVLSIVGPEFINPILIKMGVKDIRVALEVNHILIFLVPAIIYIFMTKSSFKETLRLNPLSINNIVLIFVLGIVIQPVMMFFSLITSFFFTNDVSNFINTISSTPYIVMLLLIAVTPAITEEVTLRGVVLSGYDFKNKWAASITTGVLFGIFHLNAQQFLYASVLGIVLAFLVRITNSIFAGSLLHFMVNGLQISFQKLAVPVIVNSSDAADINALRISEKIGLLTAYGMLAIIFGFFTIIIIRKIQRNCTNSGIYDYYESLSIETERALRIDVLNEKVINIPLIATIIIYIIYMVFIR